MGGDRAGRQSRRRQRRRTGRSTARRSPTSILGKITKWDDPAIAKLNPGVKLPSQAIAVVHRSDGSGTTFNFTNYLSKVSPDWKSKVGASTAVEWPVGIGAKGNEGVANNVDPDQGRDRLRRIRLRQAEQDDLRRHDQQGRQDGRSRTPRRSRPPPPTPTGPSPTGYLPDPDQPAGRRHPGRSPPRPSS